MAVPTPQAVGTYDAQAGALSVPWPAHQADDIGVLVVEYDPNGGTPPSAVTGWTQFPGSPAATGTAPAKSTGLSVWWRRAAGASEANAEVGACGNHAVGQIGTIRGCIASGNPFDVVPTPTTDDTEDDAQSAPGATTTVGDCLILNLIASGFNGNVNAWSAWTNADLTSLTEWAETQDTIGNGGGFGIAYGTKSSAGTFGATTATSQRTSPEVGFTIAFKPPAGATNLVIQDAAHTHAADSPTFTQVHVLAVQDANHAQAADNVALTQVHELQVAEATHAHAADNVALVVDLAISDGAHGHLADNLGLTQVHQLAVADAAHAHAADNLALTQVHVLAVAEAAHAHAADNVVLQLGGIDLVIADGTHAHAADVLALTQVHELAVADALHGHTADALALTQVHVLEVAEALHGHAAEQLALTQVHELGIAEGLHAHAADNLVLTVGAVDLVIAEAVHAHAAETLTLSTQEGYQGPFDQVRFSWRKRGIGSR